MSHRLVDGVYGTATYPPRIYGPPASVLGIVPKGHEWIIEQIPSVDGENKSKTVQLYHCSILRVKQQKRS